MTHPGQAQLALYAGGDLPLWRRLQIRHHLRTCGPCRGDCEQYAETRMEVKALESEVPASLNWDRLAAEMTANIHLGLEAGECVTPVRAPRPRSSWRAAAVMASMCVVLAMAWWLNPPVKQRHALRAPNVVIRTTPAGLEVNENGNTLVLVQRDRAEKPIIVSAPGVLRARYVDSDTGQITINDVYAE